MEDYFEKEIKILNIDVKKLQDKLLGLGAKMVYDGIREISTYDFQDDRYLSDDILIRLTKEEQMKITVHINNSQTNRKIIRIHPKENRIACITFLSSIGFVERTRVKARRISYIWNHMDFDIDLFPEIPPFVEIDLENITISINNLLEQLDLQNNKIVTCGTENIFKLYGINYFTFFKINTPE